MKIWSFPRAWYCSAPFFFTFSFPLIRCLHIARAAAFILIRTCNKLGLCLDYEIIQAVSLLTCNTRWPTYLLANWLTNMPTGLPICLPPWQLASWLTCKSTFKPAYNLKTDLSTCLPACLSSCLPAHLLTCLPAYLPTYLRSLVWYQLYNTVLKLVGK